MFQILFRSLVFGLAIACLSVDEISSALESDDLTYSDPLLEPWRISRFPELEGKGLRCIAEDQAGNIWFGLRDGAIRYDGYQWIHAGTDKGLPPIAVQSLACRSDGSMVAATGKGLFEQRDDRWQQIFPVDENTTIQTNYVIEAEDRTLWVCSPLGLIKIVDRSATLFTSEAIADFAKQKQCFDQVILLPNDCLPGKRNYSGSDLFLHSDTVIAMGPESPARSAGLRLGDKVISVNGDDSITDALKQRPGVELKLVISRGLTKQRESISFTTGQTRGNHRSPAMNVVMEDSEGRIWACAVRGKLMMSLDQGKNWTTWTKNQGLLTNSHPYALEAADGSIWVFSSGRKENVCRFVAGEWVSERLMALGGISFIGSAAQTRDGTIWAGGLNRIHVMVEGEWRTHDTRDVKLPSESHRMMVASDGAIWIGGYDQSAVRIAISDQEFVSLQNAKYLCGEPSGIQWYWDSETTSMLRRDGNETVAYGVDDGTIDGPSGMVAVPGAGVVVVGSHEADAAVSTFDGKKWIRKTFPEVARDFSGKGLTVTREGKVWVGAKGNRREQQIGGIIHGFGEHWQHHYPPEAPAFCTSAMELTDGRMWFGGGFGVIQFDGINWSRIRDPLLSGTACPSGAIDSTGTVWMATRTKGVLRCQDGRWSSLNVDNGLLTNEISTVHVDSKDQLWVSTRDGLCRFDGKRFVAVKLPEHWGRATIGSDPVVGVWFDGASRIITDLAPPRAFIKRSNVTVDSGGEAFVSWHGVDKWNRTPSHELTWSWRIDGGPWSPFKLHAGTTLRGMDAGKHYFEVRCRDGDLNLSAIATPLAITVLRPYWQRPWFVASAMLAAFTLSWQSMRLFRRGVALRRTNRELALARRELAELFEEKSAQFRAICDCSPIGIFVTDTTNAITYFNERLARVAGMELGYRGEWIHSIHPDDREQVLASWYAAVSTKGTFATSARFLRDDGSIRWIDVVANCIQRDGHFLGYVGAVDDVTDRIIADQELKKSNVELRDALEQLAVAQNQMIRKERLSALGQMAAGVAHDINNSLTPLLTYAELLEKEQGLSPSGREWAQLVRLGVSDTSNTVRRLDHFYRNSRNSDSLADIDVAEIARQSIDLTRPKWLGRTAPNDLQIDVAADIRNRPIIKGDASQLRAVLTNLLFNAVDALTESGKITIRVDCDSKNAIIEVSDTGQGMSDDLLIRCMDPFFTTKNNGSGLGLSECHGIIRQHGGNMRIDSVVGEGTTIRCEIPRVMDSIGQATEVPSSDDQNATRKTRSRSDLPKVLCIDDDELVRSSTAALLSTLQVNVVTAVDGFSGLALLENESFDFVLCDQGLPGMLGTEVVKSIKSRWPDLPVAIVSGWALPALEDDAKPDAVVEKPFSIKTLEQLLETYLPSPVQPR